MSTLPIGLRMLYNLFIAGLVVTLLTMSTLPIGLRMQPVDSGTVTLSHRWTLYMENWLRLTRS